MSGSKTELRRLIRAERSVINHDEICKRILEHPWYQRAKTVMAYAALPSEADLSLVIEDVLASGKTLILPRCEDMEQMTARRVGSLDALSTGAYGILEPGDELPVVEKGTIDLVLVPGMAFDRQGGRLGKGKGYYDRFLRDFRGYKIGVCIRLMDEIPMDANDIRMDTVITETEVILCGKERTAWQMK